MADLQLSLESNCWNCASADVDPLTGNCHDCGPGQQLVPADRRSTSVYGGNTVSDMLSLIHAGSIRDVDEEIAALAVEAKRLMDLGNMTDDQLSEAELTGEISSRSMRIPEADRVVNLRLALTGVASLKEKRSVMLEREGFHVTYDHFQVFLGEVLVALRAEVDNQEVLERIGLRLAKLSLKFRKSARPAV